MDFKKISNNVPRAGLYALLKSRSQQQQQSNNNNINNNNINTSINSHSIQQIRKLQEKEVLQKELANHPSPTQTKKPPPPLVKPKPKRPSNFIRTNSKSETFVRNASKDN